MRSCVIPFVRHFNETNLSKEEIASKLKNARDEYVKIFKPEISKAFSYNDSYVDKSQNPILTFVYKADPKMRGHDYGVVMQKIIMVSPLSLDQFIVLKKGVAETSDITAGFEETNGVKFRYSRQHDSLAKNIYVTYDDTFLSKTTFGDNIVNYDFQIKNFNICGGLNEKLIMGFESDFIARPNRPFFPVRSSFNLNMTVIKKGKSIFIVVIYARASDFKIDSKILEELFETKVN